MKSTKTPIWRLSLLMGTLAWTAAFVQMVPAATPTYDLARDYSTNANPAGAWSYGWKSSLSDNPTLFTRHGFESLGGGLIDYWLRPSGPSSVYHNAGSTTLTVEGGQGVLPPGTVWFGPGYDGASDNYSNIRLTVPSGGQGTYQMDVVVLPYLNGPSSGDCDFHILRNNVEIIGQNLPASSGTNYSRTITLAAGDTVDFAVGRGLDGHESGSALKIQATFNPTSTATYDLSRDYSLSANPNGVWSYGWKTTLGGSFGLLGYTKTFSSDNGVPLADWQLTANQAPVLARNMGNSTAVSSGGAFTGPPGTVWLDPGFDGTPQNFGVVRFTVPSGGNGDYRVETTVHSLFDGSISEDGEYHVVRNGVEVFGQLFPPNSGTGYTNTFSLVAGDTVDFAVGKGPDGVAGRSGLKIQATISRVTANPPAARFDLVRDYSTNANPGGAWSYGWKSTLPGTLTLFPIHGFEAHPNGGQLDYWIRVFGGSASVYHSSGTGTVYTDGGQGVFPPGTIMFGPGYDNDPDNFGVIRLTVPPGNAGTYQLDVGVQSRLNGPSASDNDFHVLLNGTEIIGQQLAPSAGANFSQAITLSDGDTLDFAAGRGADGHVAGGGLKIQATLTASSGGGTAPTITSQPQSLTVTAGNTANFTVGAQGSQPLSYQWRFNGTPIQGATGSSLTLSNVQSGDAGGYSVEVTNSAGSVTSGTASLTVTPYVPANFDLVRDYSTNTNPGGAWSYGWKSTLSGTLNLFPIHGFEAHPNGGQLDYWIRVFGGSASVYHSSGTSTVYTDGGQGVFPPGTIMFGPGYDNDPDNFGVIRLTVPPGNGGTYQLNVAVQSRLNGPSASDNDFHVLLNGTEIIGQQLAPSAGANFSQTITLSDGDALDFAAGRGADGHVAGGGLKIQADLTLSSGGTAPTITSQPQDVTVSSGSAANFTVVAQGTAPLTYQWRFNGSPISGATSSSLRLSNVNSNNAGSYSVEVNNGLGSVTSASATLTVTPYVPAAFDLVNDYSTNANPAGPWSYGWKSTLAGALTLFTRHGFEPQSGGGLLDYWLKPSGGPSAVYHNCGTVTVTNNNGQGVYPPGVVWFGPGYNGAADNFGVIRFTVPSGAGGVYRLDANVHTSLDGGISGDSDFHIVLNGAEIFGQQVGPNGGATFNESIALSDGDTIDFASGRGADGREYASGFKIQASLTPSSDSPAPRIISQPQSLTVQAGNSATFNVQVLGISPLTYQWRFNGADIQGANGSSLTLSGVQNANQGAYSVQVSNAFGVVESSDATLTVLRGADFDLSRDFSTTSNPGGPWTYGYKTTLDGALTPFALFTQVYDDGGALQDVWHRIAGTPSAIQHNGTTTTGHSDGGAGTYPPGTTLLFPGYEGNVDNYGAVRFTAPAAGTYSLLTVVRSYLDGPISGDTDFHVVRNGTEVFGQFLPGNGSASYSNALTLAAGDTLDFLVGRGQDNHLYASGLKIVTTLDLVSTEPTAPSIVTQPQSQTVAVGSSATFSVVANGSGPLSYQWLRGTNEISGATAASLRLNNLQVSDAGSYRVRVSNDLGSVLSSAATLTVNDPLVAPSITSITPSHTVTAGSQVSLSVVASGSAPLSYQWRFNSTDISGATSATYTINSAQLTNAGSYTVRVTNSVGSVISPVVQLTVTQTNTPPTITAQPATIQDVNVGGSVSLSVTASGTGPLQYQWKFNGVAISGANSSTLALNNVQASDAGAYWVTVSNPFGSATSQGANLNVLTGQSGGQVVFVNNTFSLVYEQGTNRVPAGTAYLVQLYGGASQDSLEPLGGAISFRLPGRFNGNIRTVPTVASGQTAWFQVKVWETAFGTTYEQALVAGGKTGASTVFSLVTGGGGSPPSPPPTLYTFDGTGLQSFTLVPGQPQNAPQITAHPQDQSVLLGANAAFSVTATGDPLQYQWRLNGADIPNARAASLSIVNARVSNAGDYDVVVRNGAGAVTSAVARLTVTVERVLSLEDPADAHEGDLVSVPLQLVSQGDVGGLTFRIDYDPDYLSAPEISWGAAVDGALKEVNVPSLGHLRGVFVLPSTAVASGTQLLATVQFRARTVSADTLTALNLQVIDLSGSSGDPIVYGTDVRSATAQILYGGSTGLTGDNNGNNRVDIGDASLLLRLLAQLDTVRAWDLPRNDFNQNAVLDSGDAIKILRIVAGIDSPPQQMLAAAPAKGSSSAFGPSAAMALGGGAAVLAPARLSGSPGQLVTIQVRLEDVLTPISGATLTLNYPPQALRLPGSQSLRVGSSAPAGTLAVWNVGPSQNNYATQNGHVTLALSSATPWTANNGVLAELTFEIQPGATNQLTWPVTLSSAEVTANGYNTQALGAGSTVLVGRQQAPATLGGFARRPSGQFEFTITGDVGASYVVEASEDLVHWSLITNIANSASSVSVVDGGAVNFDHRFYRARPAE